MKVARLDKIQYCPDVSKALSLGGGLKVSGMPEAFFFKKVSKAVSLGGGLKVLITEVGALVI
ncbi:MAG: hypothetical protein V7K88_19490 [Nostoc sp.]|uniref:hypothetical protein n=1 Tax=Nostoc sp. TaxID=1180 RepID=UPI002FF7E58D